jgi:UDP-N-acetylmuramate dehydrogenase
MDIASGKVVFDEPMSRHTSMGVGGTADALVSPGNVEELRQIIACLKRFHIPFIPIGNGTNLIVKDGGYRGAIISMKGLRDITLTERSTEQISIYSGAGAALSEIVLLAAEHSLTGMEFCAGIPGSIGGAVKMNAGAYGSEIRNIIETVELMSSSEEIRQHKGDELNFEYRNLDLPADTMITGASFLLTRERKEQIQKRISEIISARKSKHPLEYRNAGSIFKNPGGKGPAGKIIDETGLKGTRIGGAKISEKHGNFIINLGDAKAADIIALIDVVQKKVKNERGVELETEVKIIGEDG